MTGFTLTDDRAQQIVDAVTALQQNSGSPVGDLLLTDPLTALNQQLATQGAAPLDIDSSFIASFNSALLSDLPATALVGYAKRSDDSWKCFFCKVTVHALVYGGLAAGGTALFASSGGSITAVIAAVATALKISAGVLTAGLVGAGVVIVETFASWLSDFCCSLIHLCVTPPPYKGMWTQDQKIGSWETVAGPALATMNGTPVVLHIGDDHRNLYWGTFSRVNQSWDGDTIVSDMPLTGGPAAMTAGNVIWVFYRSRASGTTVLARSTSDCSKWGPVLLTSVQSMVTPAAVPFPTPSGMTVGALLLTTQNGSDVIASAVDLGAAHGTIFPPASIVDATTVETPALVFFNGYYWGAYSDATTKQIMITASADGQNWTSPVVVGSGATAMGGPALAASGNQLYCVFTQSNGTLRYAAATMIGTTPFLSWGSEDSIDGHESSTGPALLVQGSSLLCTHKGNDKDMWWTSALP
jgi:hypothetical protein